MTDYTKATNFTAKDDLPAGADAKTILGAEWDTELTAIATAIASKYDDGDISDQSTAEAGASNAVLLTPLRFAQFAAASKMNRTSEEMEEWSYSRLTVATDYTFDTGQPISTWPSILTANLAAGLNLVRIRTHVITTVQTTSGAKAALTFSVTPTRYAVGTSRTNSPSAGDGGHMGDLSINQSVSIGGNTFEATEYLFGFVLMPSAGTVTLRLAGNASGSNQAQAESFLAARVL